MSFSKYIIYIFIAFLIATEGIFTGNKIAGIDIHRLIELIFFIFIFKIFYKDIQSNKLLFKFITFVLIFASLLLLKLGVLTFFKDEINTDIFFDLFRLLLMVPYTYIIYFLINKNFNFLKLILFFNSIIFLIALLQFQIFPSSETAWMIKFNYFNANSGARTEDLVDKTRIVGLYAYSIPLVYAVLSNIFLSLYIYIKEKSNIYIFYIIFLSLVGILTLTRSLVLAIMVIWLYLIYKLIIKSKLHVKVISIFLFMILSFSMYDFYQEKAESLSRLSSTNDGSFNTRIPLAMTGLYTLLSNPLGASKKEIDQIRLYMYHVYNNPAVLRLPSHVGIIDLGLEYTLIGIFVFIYMIYYFYRYIKYFPKEIKNFFIVIFLAYMLNASFHNGFILSSDYYILIIFAILMYEYKQNQDGKV